MGKTETFSGSAISTNPLRLFEKFLLSFDGYGSSFRLDLVTDLLKEICDWDWRTLLGGRDGIGSGGTTTTGTIGVMRLSSYCSRWVM